MPTNFELKRLKLKLDIAKKPENRVHELTDSNVSRLGRLNLKGFWQITLSTLNNVNSVDNVCYKNRD